jgi:hypothetical protein
VAQAEKVIRLMTAQEKIAIMDTLGDAKEKNQIHRTHVRHTGAGGLYGSAHDSETTRPAIVAPDDSEWRSGTRPTWKHTADWLRPCKIFLRKTRQTRGQARRKE